MSIKNEKHQLNRRLWRNAYMRMAIYGGTPPVECWSRLAAEEAALHGTDAIQAISVLHKIALAAAMQNTMVVVNGTINSSYAAWLCGATMVNPLKPHYFCPECGKVNFIQCVADGFDLEPKICACGTPYERDGHDIPFESYVATAQTSNSAEIQVSDSFKSTAIQVIKDFYATLSEILPIKLMNTDGSLASEKIVVLFGRDDLPPVAEDGFWHATIEEYLNWLDNELVFTIVLSEKLNEIQRLQTETGIELPEPEQLITPAMIGALYQSRQTTAKPITDYIVEGESIDFDLLTRIEGFIHATGAWEGNGDALVKTGIAKFRDLPASREDVFATVTAELQQQQVFDRGFALQVMEQARKGLYNSRSMPARVERMLHSLNLPEWYPEHLKKVRYLFPKGHCVAMIIRDLVLQWYMDVLTE